MKTILKHFIINTVSLYAVSLVISGIVFADGTYSLLLAGIVLTLASMVIKPIINLLLLPLNLITFGLFRWVGFAITLYLVTLIIPGFKIIDFVFRGFSSYWFSIPAFSLPGILAIIAFSFLLSIIASFGYWIFK
ncbi:MAG TPA: phage holin family protein [Candidatus Saccharimonadales bacterium]|jgi:putative membrane protein|nr:phage holin family protein [Candidatus Saccharimonadales bacterium]